MDEQSIRQLRRQRHGALEEAVWHLGNAYQASVELRDGRYPDMTPMIDALHTLVEYIRGQAGT